MEGTTCLGRRQNLPEDHLIFHTLEKLQTKMAERFSLNSHIVSSVIYSDQHLYEISLEEWNLFAGKMRARKKDMKRWYGSRNFSSRNLKNFLHLHNTRQNIVSNILNMNESVILNTWRCWHTSFCLSWKSLSLYTVIGAHKLTYVLH